MTEVIQQVSIAGSLRERRAKVVNRLGKLASFDLRDSQRFPGTDFLQMWYGFRSISLCQESIAEELVHDRQIGAQLERSFQGRNRGAVVMLFHVRSAEIHESVRQSRVDFSRLAKLRYFHVDLVLLPRLETPCTCCRASDAPVYPASQTNKKSWIISAPVHVPRETDRRECP